MLGRMTGLRVNPDFGMVDRLVPSPNWALVLTHEGNWHFTEALAAPVEIWQQAG